MDYNALNQTIATVFCDTFAEWTHGATITPVLLAIDLQVDTSGDDYAISSTETAMAGCRSASIIGMANGDTLAYHGQTYIVQQVIIRAGWATLFLEKS